MKKIICCLVFVMLAGCVLMTCSDDETQNEQTQISMMETGMQEEKADADETETGIHAQEPETDTEKIQMQLLLIRRVIQPASLRMMLNPFRIP